MQIEKSGESHEHGMLPSAIPVMRRTRGREFNSLQQESIRRRRYRERDGSLVAGPCGRSRDAVRAAAPLRLVRPAYPEAIGADVPAPRLVAKGPDDRIFPYSRQWLRLHTIRLCKLAGVPRVTPHGLRGTFASLDVEGSDILERTAGRLGHSSSTTTERHYATEDAVAFGRASRVGANLEAALARLQQKNRQLERQLIRQIQLPEPISTLRRFRENYSTD
jgi:hypothetical protein